MAYRYGDRKQGMLFPQSVDDYISADEPVRAYDVIVDSLDFDELGIEINSQKVGCPQYGHRGEWRSVGRSCRASDRTLCTVSTLLLGSHP